MGGVDAAALFICVAFHLARAETRTRLLSLTASGGKKPNTIFVTFKYSCHFMHIDIRCLLFIYFLRSFNIFVRQLTTSAKLWERDVEIALCDRP